MMSQWQALLKNLGSWQGSFTQFSDQGVFLEDTPSLVTLTGMEENTRIRQTIQRSPIGKTPTETVLEYSSLGRGVLVMATGAFSQGSMQLAPFTEFGAELGLIADNRRLRLVQLYRDRQLTGFTLIREHLAGTEAPDQPAPELLDLLGTWQGEATTYYLDGRAPETISTTLRLSLTENQHLEQQLSFAGQTIVTTARIELPRLHFDQGNLPIQVLLLPGGASATCPPQLQLRQPFFLEVGWLIQPNRRQRLIRRYDDSGAWVSLTLVTEQK